MRIRFAFEIRINRQPKPVPEQVEQHEHRDNDGTLSENIGHPRYIGFMREDERGDDGNH